MKTREELKKDAASEEWEKLITRVEEGPKKIGHKKELGLPISYK